jgi:NAD-dependent deacetylase
VLVYRAGPNPGHRAVAELEAIGVVKAVITQNVDGLHQKAGSRNVVELHGRPRGAEPPLPVRRRGDP